MPRQRPEDEGLPTNPVAAVPLRRGTGGQRPTDQGARIRPFLVDGGLTSWFGIPYVEPAEVAGVQLLASFYVPSGMVGFVKSIKACPYKPSILRGAVNNQLVPNASATTITQNNPDGDEGFWRTPMGWEGYEDVDGGFPSWRWHLRSIPGDIAAIREKLNIPAFSFVDPLSWYLVPNLPVPVSGYPAGIPGSTLGADWGPQRIQRFGAEDGEVHVPIAGDNTVCLFAEWTQGAYQPVYQSTTGAGLTTLPQLVLALGPSFGQLGGYTQPQNSKAGQASAREGWES